MQFIISLCGFVAVWLLFSFPLYQATLELSSQSIMFSQKVKGSLGSVKRISKWYWLLPPLKIHKEKQRSINIIRQLNLDEMQVRVLLNYLDKATAWFYVALAGWLNAVFVTNDLLERWGQPQAGWLLLAIIIVMTFIAIGNVKIRVDAERIEHKIKHLSQIFKS